MNDTQSKLRIMKNKVAMGVYGTFLLEKNAKILMRNDERTLIISIGVLFYIGITIQIQTIRVVN